MQRVWSMCANGSGGLAFTGERHSDEYIPGFFVIEETPSGKLPDQVLFLVSSGGSPAEVVLTRDEDARYSTTIQSPALGTFQFYASPMPEQERYRGAHPGFQAHRRLWEIACHNSNALEDAALNHEFFFVGSTPTTSSPA